MQKSDNHLEWVQRQIQDLIVNNVTTDWPAYNDDE
jgi:hypothetical protein